MQLACPPMPPLSQPLFLCRQLGDSVLTLIVISSSALQAEGMTCPNCLTATTLLHLPLSLPLSLLLSLPFLLQSLSPGGAIVSPVPLPVPVPGRIFNVRLWLQNVFHSIFYVLAPRQPQKAHSAAPPSPSCASLAA